MNKTCLIKNGLVVTKDSCAKKDILIKGKSIAKIATSIQFKADLCIDASEKIILPGRLDPHTHFDLNVNSNITSDDFISGTRAALFGGTTTFIDFANQKKGFDLFSALNEFNEKAEGNSYIDYSMHMAITDLSLSLNQLDDIFHIHGIKSFKFFTTYDSMKLSYVEIFNAIREIGKMGGISCIHAEDDDIINENIAKLVSEGKIAPCYHPKARSVITETTAIENLNEISDQIYFMHVSSGSGAYKVNKLKSKFAETCIQYLILDDSKYSLDPNDAIKYVMSPPLRSKEEKELLWKALKEGVIDTIATDHCPFDYKLKQKGVNDFRKIPNGIGSVEHVIPLLYTYGVLTEKISLQQMVSLISQNPARIFGFSKKGAICVGADADIVIFDPRHTDTISAKTHHSLCDYSPYEGIKVNGRIDQVFIRGILAMNDGICLIEPGFGKRQVVL